MTCEPFKTVRISHGCKNVCQRLLNKVKANKYIIKQTKTESTRINTISMTYSFYT